MRTNPFYPFIVPVMTSIAALISAGCGTRLASEDQGSSTQSQPKLEIYEGGGQIVEGSGRGGTVWMKIRKYGHAGRFLAGLDENVPFSFATTNPFSTANGTWQIWPCDDARYCMQFKQRSPARTVNYVVSKVR